MGITNPFPERADGLPIVDQQGKRVGTAYTKADRPTQIRITDKAVGCMEPHRGKILKVERWNSLPLNDPQGNLLPSVFLPGDDPEWDLPIMVWRDEWEPA